MAAKYGGRLHGYLLSCLGLIFLTACIVPKTSADTVWWDRFETFDVDNFDNWYDKDPSTNMWHVTEQSSPFIRRLSGEHSLWYGSESTGNYDTGTTNNGAIMTIPFGVGGTGTVEMVVSFWSWEETDGINGRDTRSVYWDLNDDDWHCIFRSSRLRPGWNRIITDTFEVSSSSNIRIKFEFDTNGTLDNCYGGWYVEDFYVIRLEGSKKGCPFEGDLLEEWPVSSRGCLYPAAVATINRKDYTKGDDASINQNDLNSVPAMGVSAVFFLLALMGILLHRRKSPVRKLLLVLLLVGIPCPTTNAFFHYSGVQGADDAYDGKADMAGSDDWAIMVWETGFQHHSKLAIARWNMSGSGIWSDKMYLDTGTLRSSRNPSIDLNSSDNSEFWIAWDAVDSSGTRNIYCGVYKPSLGAWSYSKVNNSSYDSCTEPSVSGEDLRVVYTVKHGSSSDIYASKWNGSSWDTMEQVNPAGHTLCNGPVTDHNYVMYSAMDGSGNIEIYMRYRSTYSWMGNDIVSEPADTTPDIRVDFEYDASNARIYAVWVRSIAGSLNEQVYYREHLNYQWQGTGQPITGQTGDFVSLAYDPETDIVWMVTEVKHWADTEHHELRQLWRNMMTPTPVWSSMTLPNGYPPDDYRHLMNPVVADVTGGFMITAWSGSPRTPIPDHVMDLEKRSIVHGYINYVNYWFTPTPGPPGPTPTPTYLNSGMTAQCNDPTPFPLNNWVPSGPGFRYGEDDPMYLSDNSNNLFFGRVHVYHQRPHVNYSTGCFCLEAGERYWFRVVGNEMDPSIRDPFDISHWEYNNSSFLICPHPTPGAPTATPKPVPYMSARVEPWEFCPSSGGVVKFIVDDSCGSQGPPGDIHVGSYIIATSSEYTYNSTDSQWEFIWDGHVDDNGELKLYPVGRVFFTIDRPASWTSCSWKQSYRSSLTLVDRP